MYKILLNGTALATVNNPSWVKKQENGCFALCDEATAQGVVVDGVVYHVSGKEEIENCDTVILGEVSETAYQLEQQAAQTAANLETQAAIAELSIIIASSAMTITE